jgi:hypothetical protein
MEIYNITLIKRNNAIHVVSNEMMGRIKYETWSDFLDTLRDKFNNTLNWSLYERIPVYEYHTSMENLKYVISDFVRRELNGNASFKEVNYDGSQISI